MFLDFQSLDCFDFEQVALISIALAIVPAAYLMASF